VLLSENVDNSLWQVKIIDIKVDSSIIIVEGKRAFLVG
jgi:hypothetical protein